MLGHRALSQLALSRLALSRLALSQFGLSQFALSRLRPQRLLSGRPMTPLGWPVGSTLPLNCPGIPARPLARPEVRLQAVSRGVD